MKITCTSAEANTLRAAFSSHRDKASDALARAWRAKDAGMLPRSSGNW